MDFGIENEIKLDLETIQMCIQIRGGFRNRFGEGSEPTCSKRQHPWRGWTGRGGNLFRKKTNPTRLVHPLKGVGGHAHVDA